MPPQTMLLTAARGIRLCSCSSQNPPVTSWVLCIKAKIFAVPKRPYLDWITISSPSPPTVPFCLITLAILVPLVFFEPSWHIPASRPLHLLFPLPETLFLQIFGGSTLSLSLIKCHLLHELFKVKLSLSQYSLFPYLALIFSMTLTETG